LSIVSNILSAMADEKALLLLNTLATKEYESEAIVGIMDLSRKAYYSRMARFVKLGIVKRKKGKYSLTMFGKILHEVQTVIDIAVNNYWKLKALDELEMTADMPEDERKKIIDTLIDTKMLRRMFFALVNETGGG
jgi:predicted transcriptional regulator